LNINRIPHTVKNNRGRSISIISAITTFFSFFSIFFAFIGLNSVYAVELFSKDDKPFGVSYDDWFSKYWNLWVAKNTDEATPKPGGCLTVNTDSKSDSFVMLMETADVGSPPAQVCKITSKQGIMIPLWIAWCDNSAGGRERNPNEPLAKCAREQYNLGNIRSDVSVDGVPVAKLDVRMSLISGSLDYKVNSLANVTELYTKNFNLTIPSNTHKADVVPGTWSAGSHGWWVFLKPLPHGQHSVYYNIRVTPTGALTSPGTNPHFADITYKLQVEK
jgi:hypothetical protein